MKRKVDLIVIHTTATREDKPYSVEQLARDHKARGFSEPGYHRYIRRDGTVVNLRHFDKIGAHAAGFNKNSIGISYEGGLDVKGQPKDTRTPAQIKAIVEQIKEAQAYAGAGAVKRIVGHRDLSPDLDGDGQVEPNEWIKQCPCFDAIPEYKHLL
jgi:N-acetylmuramoyl-L-alanine amidase